MVYLVIICIPKSSFGSACISTSKQLGSLGVTLMVVYEPATWYIWFTVACPALVSSTILYVGLFTELSPVALPYSPGAQVVILVCGVIIASSGDIVNALRDLRYPLWGE